MYNVSYKKPVIRLAHQTNNQGQKSENRIVMPFTNIVNADNGWSLIVSLPGYSKEEVSIALADKQLTISCSKEKSELTYQRKEWSNDAFERTFTMPELANTSQIEAEMNNGILKIFIPKKEKTMTKVTVL